MKECFLCQTHMYKIMEEWSLESQTLHVQVVHSMMDKTVKNFSYWAYSLAQYATSIKLSQETN